MDSERDNQGASKEGVGLMVRMENSGVAGLQEKPCLQGEKVTE